VNVRLRKLVRPGLQNDNQIGKPTVSADELPTLSNVGRRSRACGRIPQTDDLEDRPEIARFEISEQ
jgi:hypothetical protein